jgi:hypothetical protein
MLRAGGSPVGKSAVQGPGLNPLHPGIAPRCLRTSFKMLLGRLVIDFGWVFREFLKRCRWRVGSFVVRPRAGDGRRLLYIPIETRGRGLFVLLDFKTCRPDFCISKSSSLRVEDYPAKLAPTLAGV